MRGNLADDRQLVDGMNGRLDAERREPGRMLIATRVEGLTLFVAETKSGKGSFVAVYGRTGTPVQSMRLVDLGKPPDATTLSLGIDNAVAKVALVVPAPTVTRVAIKAGVDAAGQPVMVEVPIRDGVASLPLKGQRPANILIDLEVDGQAVTSVPELQALDVDDPVKAQPNFKPDLEDEPSAEAYERNYLALGAFVALVALGVAAIWAAGRTKNIASHSRWSVPALAAIGLTLAAPLVWVAASLAMYYLSASDPSFEAPAYWLPFVPAILVCVAAIRCAHTGLQQARDPARRPALALSAGATELVVAFAYLVGVLLVVAGGFFALLSLGGGTLSGG
ncbi:hypothetical protein AB0E63_10150 [Kribbella sp. NPDC026596]|uniref:hypothetical protein n=1 Tax=Kribbella sp. NPDC026596 TaxID=3155122 RepID=UPI0033D6F16C